MYKRQPSASGRNSPSVTAVPRTASTAQPAQPCVTSPNPARAVRTFAENGSVTARPSSTSAALPPSTSAAQLPPNHPPTAVTSPAPAAVNPSTAVSASETACPPSTHGSWARRSARPRATSCGVKSPDATEDEESAIPSA